MFFSFILFILIGFIPFISAFFGLDINLQQTKRLLPSTLIYFFLYSCIKLFTISVVLTELQGQNIQTFIVTLVINSFEFVAVRSAYARNKVKNTEKGNTIAFWWSALTAFLTTILTFISNSRTYELEAHHISYAASTLSYLFVIFAMQNLTLSIGQIPKISNLNSTQQFFILLLGVPNAVASVDPKGIMPLFVPDLLKIISSFLLWFVSKKIYSSEITNKEKQN